MPVNILMSESRVLHTLFPREVTSSKYTSSVVLSVARLESANTC